MLNIIGSSLCGIALVMLLIAYMRKGNPEKWTRKKNTKE